MLRRRERPSQTPTVYVEDHEYAVGLRTRTFKGARMNGRVSIGFESRTGKQIWGQCMILESKGVAKYGWSYGI